MTKPFMFFLALFVALGLSIGGSFAGGVAFGRSQDNEAGAGTPTLAIPGNFARSSGSNFGGNFGQTSAGRSPQSSTADSTGDGGLPENLAELRQRIQSGDVSPEDLASTIYHVLGIDSNWRIPDASGRPIPLVDGGTPLVDLFS